MKFTWTNIFLGLLILSFLAFLTMTQTQISEQLQLFLFFFGALTIFALIKFDKIGKVLFLVIFSLSIFIVYFFLTNFLIDKINPNRGWAIDNNGQRLGRVMDPSILLGIPVGLLLTPLTIRLYVKKIKPNKNIETACITLYTIATAILYITFKLR